MPQKRSSLSLPCRIQSSPLARIYLRRQRLIFRAQAHCSRPLADGMAMTRMKRWSSIRVGDHTYSSFRCRMTKVQFGHMMTNRSCRRRHTACTRLAMFRMRRQTTDSASRQMVSQESYMRQSRSRCSQPSVEVLTSTLATVRTRLAWLTFSHQCGDPAF